MTAHQHHPVTDDATIDGADLLAEIRAQLGYGPAPAPAPTPTNTTPASTTGPDEEFTIDGFEFLQQIQAEANVDPFAVAHRPAATATTRWVPPAPEVGSPATAARPGRWQLAIVIGAFLAGVMLTALAMTLLGWGLGA